MNGSNEIISAFPIYKMIYYNFCIKVFASGKQFPSIDLPLGKYEFLADLAQKDLAKSSGITTVLDEIKKVQQGLVKKYLFGSSECCLIEVKKDFSLLINLFDKYEPYEVSTIEIVNFLEGWQDFLSKYENGLIPGLKTNNI